MIPTHTGSDPVETVKMLYNNPKLRLCAKKGHDTWVLDADIEGFFDNIEHESILDATRNNSLIEGWLKAGFVESKKGYNRTEIGTPQGGVISPLLANIGLHGLETYIRKLNPIA